MTNEEAVTGIKTWIDPMKKHHKDNEFALEFIECAWHLAKKQILKKPNFIELGSDKYWLCPVCGDVVLGILEDDQIKCEYDHDFCGGCGQAIDWGEGE